MPRPPGPASVLSEERLKDVLALKDRTDEKIERCHRELEMLEKEAAVLDDVLKQSSFARASSLPRGQAVPERAPPESGAQGGGPEPVKLVWKKEQREIGSAVVTPERVSITLDESVSVDAGTPPFESFFMGKVIGGMRKKDSDEGVPDPIECTVGKDGPAIRTITVTGYRDPGRVGEIINTAEWSLNRMLERAAE